MANLLITGGAGFIGANFVHYWTANHVGDRVIVLDALTYAGNRQSLAGLEENAQFEFCRGDINDAELVKELLATHEIDTIVHFAAESHVDRSIHSPGDFIRTNIDGTHCLLAAARQTWHGQAAGKRFHHVSTDEVFGSLEPNAPAFHERTRYAPNSPYAASKAASDHLVRAYHKTYDLPVTISNCSNNYGPFQFPEKLIPLVLVNILNGRSLPVYGDGQNVRDWLYVTDHCRAIELVLAGGRVGQTYNVGGNNEIRNIDLVQRVCSSVDARYVAEPSLKERFPSAPPAAGEKSSALIAFVEDRAGHDRRYAIDAHKIESELEFRLVESFDTGIEATIDWYLDHESWWQAVMDGSYRQWIAQNYRERELS